MSLKSWFYDLLNTPEPEPMPGARIPYKPKEQPLGVVASKLIACIEAGDFREAQYYHGGFGCSTRTYSFAAAEDLDVQIKVREQVDYDFERDASDWVIMKKTATCHIAHTAYSLASHECDAILAAFDIREAEEAKEREAHAEAARQLAIAKIEAYVPRVTTEQQNNQ